MVLLCHFKPQFPNIHNPHRSTLSTLHLHYSLCRVCPFTLCSNLISLSNTQSSDTLFDDSSKDPPPTLLSISSISSISSHIISASITTRLLHNCVRIFFTHWALCPCPESCLMAPGTGANSSTSNHFHNFTITSFTTPPKGTFTRLPQRHITPATSPTSKQHGPVLNVRSGPAPV